MPPTRSNFVDQVNRRVDDAFARLDGFALSGLMCHASCPESADGEPQPGRLWRSLHCEAENWFSLIEVYGSPRSAASRLVTARLQAAGYAVRAKWHDEVLLHRGLRTRRDAASELRFLEALGDDASPQRWPARPVREPAQGCKPRKREREREQLLRLVADAQATSIPWESVVVRFSRRHRVRMPGGASVMLTVYADLLAYVDGPTRGHVMVQVVPADATARLPLAPVRRLSTAFQEPAYTVSRHRNAFAAWRTLDGIAAVTQLAPSAFDQAHKLLVDAD
jgi:hypothetical protein